MKSLVARENPRAARPEQARFLDAHTLQLQTSISELGYKKLERARKLMGSGDGEWLSLEAVIERLAEFYLERKDPVCKAERVIMRANRASKGKVDEPMSQEWDATPKTLPANSAQAMPHAEAVSSSLEADSDVASNSAQARSEEQNLKLRPPVNVETIPTASTAIPAAVGHHG
ncbi:MAG: hypothetical protein NDI61_07030 [Bdellovibrionaceae bacterium]|nr:hypothetical protein [Pseudobdellovibrionaceae bacterium]